MITARDNEGYDPNDDYDKEEEHMRNTYEECTCIGRRLNPEAWSEDCPIDGHREKAIACKAICEQCGENYHYHTIDAKTLSWICPTTRHRP